MWGSAAAEDTERLRQIFVGHAAAPRRTIRTVSRGASVAALGAEMFPPQPKASARMTPCCSPVAGLAGARARTTFAPTCAWSTSTLCNNHPRPTEVQYPLNIGLPADATLTTADLAARVNECLGADKPASVRTAEQQRRVKVITDVIRIPASSIQGHMNWATFHFRDVVQHRTGAPAPLATKACATGVLMTMQH